MTTIIKVRGIDESISGHLYWSEVLRHKSPDTYLAVKLQELIRNARD